MKNIKENKSLLNHILLIIAIFITFSFAVNNGNKVILNKSYQMFGNHAYLTSSDYGYKLDEIHAYLNNALYREYQEVHDGDTKADLPKTVASMSPKLRGELKANVIGSYGPEVSYFIMDNNTDIVYSNSGAKSDSEFEKEYNKDGYTFINTRSNVTTTYVNGKKELFNVSYNLTNNFDMYDDNNSYLQTKVLPPTVLLAVNHDFTAGGYFKDSYDVYKSDAVWSTIGFVFSSFLLLYLLIIIKKKYGIRETLDVIGQIFNKVFLEIKLFTAYFIYGNFSSINGTIAAILFIFCLYCAAMYDNENLLNVSLYKKVMEIYKSNQVFKPFSKKVQSRMVNGITRCVVSGGILMLAFLLIAMGISGPYEQLYALIIVVSFIYLLYSIFRLYSSSIKSVKDIEDVYNYTETLGLGHFNENIYLSDNSYFKEIEYNLNALNEHIKEAVEEQVKSEKMKSELVTNVSHDLKTPLTSIINYVDLMKREDIKPEIAKEYLEILDSKSQKLKKLVEDIFDISKATSGNIELHNTNINLKSLINQSISEFSDSINENDLEVRVNVDDDVYVYADGERLGRVLENLIQNSVKYSLKGTRIYIDLEKDGPSITIINISNYEMDFTSDEILTRFARADKARDLEGFGLGLSIVQSFTGLMGIDFSVTIDKDLFKARLDFKNNK